MASEMGLPRLGEASDESEAVSISLVQHIIMGAVSNLQKVYLGVTFFSEG